MNNQIQISLAFTADTKQAQMQLQNLQNSLKTLMTASPNLFPDSSVEQVRKAQSAVASLSVALKNATNVDTGKLNLTQFNESLNRSGMSLEQYRKQLQNLGPQGEKAFLQVANSVMSAETSIKRSNKLLDSFWHSLKQTAKYQISAAMFQGVTSGIRSAFNYAEDLNKSLNNIQIVTGKSSEEMARFAQQANKAAKELSATTTEYTDAALIYYQQGDSDALATKKADITIKAANAAGSNAQEMSEYLTAVWNSYDVGEEKLMQYADVMAAIGAGTATSFEEISEAMEKVASVGEATGVKFEQLSSIIATVSSVTRQSASTVGTAFKTIFARMADLELDGKVVEDGVAVTLGDVSEQLEMVGVNVLDVDGNLRDMGTVMEELMAKWDTMNDATRQAVAIAVAGKRQYTQLLALMNNQDMYESSMAMAEGAEGTVDEQAEIYAKSWEASSERVRAATEGLWDSLLDDKWFIGLNDAFAEIIEFIEKLVDSMGGPIGVFSALGMVLTKVFNQQMVQGIANMTQHLYSMSAAGKQAAESLKMEAINQANTMLDQSKSTGGYVSNEDAAIIETNKIRLNLQKDLIMNAKNMTQEQIQQYQNELDINKAYEERYIKASALLDQKEKELMTAQEEAETELIVNNLDMSDEDLQTWSGWFQEDVNKLKENAGELSAVMRDAFSGVAIDGADGFDNIVKTLDKVQVEGEDAKIALQELKDLASKGPKDGAYGKLASRIKDLTKSSSKARAEFIKQAQNYGISKEKAEKLAQAIYSISDAEKNVTRTGDAVKTHLEGIKTSAEAAKSGIQQFSKGVVGSFSSISSIAMGITSLKGAFDALSNPDMSTWEKVTSVMMSLGMGIPSLINGLTSLHSNWNKVSNGIHSAISATIQANIAQEATTTSQYKAAAAALANAQANGTEAEVKAAEIAVEEALQASKVQSELLEKQSLATKLKVLIAQKLGIAVTVEEEKVIFGDVAAKTADTGATWLLKLAQDALNGSIGATVAILLIVVATVAIVVAAIYGLVKIVQAATDAYNADAIAAEKANQALKEQKEQLENAKTAHEELLTILEEYNTAYDTLMTLTQGTKEWNEQVKEVNSSVANLISKFPELSNFVTMSNGVMTLSKEGQEYAEKKSEALLAKEEAETTLAQINANNKNAQNNKTQLARSGNEIGFWDSMKDVSQIIATPIAAALIDVTTGKGAIEKLVAEESAKTNLTELEKLFDKFGNSAFFSDQGQKLMEKITKATDASTEQIKSLIISNNNLKNTNDLLAQQLGANLLQDNKDYQNSKYKELISEFTGKKMEEASVVTNEDRKRAEEAVESKDVDAYFRAKYGENYNKDDHKIEDWGGGDVSEYRKNDQGDWELVKVDNKDGKNDLDKSDMEQIIAEQFAKDRATDPNLVDVQLLNNMYDNQAAGYVDKFGVNTQDAVAMTIAENQNGVFDLNKISEAGIQAIEENIQNALSQSYGAFGGKAVLSDLPEEYQKLQEQIDEYKKYDGFGNNTSYRDLIDEANKPKRDFAMSYGAGSEDVDLSSSFDQSAAAYEEVEKYNEALEEKKKYATEASEWIKNLSQEEKELIADTIDFSVTKNREGWEKILADAKVDELNKKLKGLGEAFDVSQEQLNAVGEAFLEMGEDSEEGAQLTVDEATRAAQAYVRLQEGVIELSENQEDYIALLKDYQALSRKDPTEKIAKSYAFAGEEMGAFKKTLSDILDIDVESISEEFLDAIDPSTLQAAASGSEAAIDQLREAFLNVEAEAENIDFEGLKQEIASLSEDTPALDLNIDSFLYKLIAAKIEAGMGAEEIQQYLSGIGISADVTPLQGDLLDAALAAQEAGGAIADSLTFTQDVNTVTAESEDGSEIPTYYEEFSYGAAQTKQHSILSNEANETEPVDTVFYPVTKNVIVGPSVPVTQTNKTTGTEVTTTTGDGQSGPKRGIQVSNIKKKVGGKVSPSTVRTAQNNAPKSSGGKGSGGSGGKGSGGTEKPKDPHELSDKAKDNKIFREKIAEQELDRFINENTTIDKLQKSINKVGRTKEEVWGSDYIKAIDDENELLRQEVKIYEDLENEAKKFREEDLQKAREAGLNIEVDAEGNIINREAVDKQIFDLEQDLEKKKIEWENAQNIAQDAELNGLLTNDDATNEKRDAVNKKYEDAKREQEKLWEEEEYNIEITKGWLENYDESHEKVLEAQEAREEALMKIRSNNLEKLSQKYEQLIDLQDRELEIIDTMKSRISDSFTDAPEFFSLMGQEFSNFTDKGEAYTQQMAEALRMFGAGEISKAGLMESLDTVWDGTSEHIQDLISWSEEMKESYANFLSDFRDQIDTASEGFEHLISLTESYESILGLMGKETDYSRLGGLYKQRSSVAESAYKSSIENYKLYLDEYSKLKKEYDAADVEAQEALKPSLEAAREAVHESQQTMLDDAEAWLETMQLIRDNAIAAAQEALEKGLFGGKSADEMNDYLDSLQAKTEDYLTETNQQYETQKMIRTAMRDIEKTENEAAKRKLENFKKETTELQKQSKLSNFELEVQQAKYELLLAEIALQEAQDAKSTVRLRRDAEGNFNYVYTADQDKVAEAEQKYADAENNLYNIRLEGANEFAEKRVQLEMELSDKIAAIMEDQTLDEEEREARVAELKEDYYQRILNAQSIYNIAAEGLGDNLSEAWSTDMIDMIGSTAEMEQNFNTYISSCSEAYKTWQTDVDTASKLIEENYGDVDEAVENVTSEVEKLRTDGRTYLSEAAKDVTQWATVTNHAVNESIKLYRDLLTLILRIKEEQGGVSKDINYMARFQSSGNVTDAFQNLLYREKKLEKYPGAWDDNITELAKEVNNERTYIDAAESLEAAAAAAARREAKLEYLKRANVGVYNELVSKYPETTEQLLKDAYIRLGATEEQAQAVWDKIEKDKAILDSMWDTRDVSLEDLAKSVQALNTGGYTGDFGPEGKLALLHEKELVLNKQDTENLLDTVDIVRDLIDSFEYNNLINSIAGLKPISIDSVGGGDFLEQEVTIHAEFPNVQDKHEIEDAIENLVLTASQFANRKS